MCTNCDHCGADLFFFCYEKDYMLSLCDNIPADVFETFIAARKALDDLLNIDTLFLKKTSATSHLTSESSVK